MAATATGYSRAPTSAGSLCDAGLYRDFTPAWGSMLYGRLVTVPSEPYLCEPLPYTTSSENPAVSVVRADSLSQYELELLDTLTDFEFDSSAYPSSTDGCDSPVCGYCSTSEQLPVAVISSVHDYQPQILESSVPGGSFDWTASTSSPPRSPFTSAEDKVAPSCPSTPPQPVVGLKVEQPAAPVKSCKVPSRVRKSSGPRGASSAPKRCMIPDCLAPLEDAYNIRYKLCKTCVRAPVLRKDGRDARFCQQCGYLHDVSEFDGPKRSCRKKLQRHASRVRKWRSAKTETNAKTTQLEMELQ